MKTRSWVVGLLVAVMFAGNVYAQAEKGAAKKVDVPKAPKKEMKAPDPDKPAEAAKPAKAEAAKKAEPKKAEAKEAKAPVEKTTVPEGGVPGGITLGIQIGEDDSSQGFGDIVAPLYYHDDGLLFFNPRYSRTDDDAEEINLGLGYRHLLMVDGKEFILGGNAYYDHRETTHNNEFDQWGVGIEFMSEWVDVRANLYMADNDEELVDRQETVMSSSSSRTYWSEIYGEGNDLKQDWIRETTRTRIRRLFEQYEASMDGFDAEIGVKIPELSDCMPTRVFVGYQSFDNPYGEDFEGMKARLEVRPMPGVTLDAEYFEEDELNGTDYYVGGRVRVPFDVQNVINGKNPFEGAEDAFKRAKEGPLSDRLTEMVMRDMKVQVNLSEYIQVLEEISRSTRRKTLWDDVVDRFVFVDADNDWDWQEDGTWEHPFNHIQEGICEAAMRPDTDYSTYVVASDETYREIAVIKDGVTVWGEGEAVSIYRPETGKTYYFGGEKYPLVDGLSMGPTFRMANDTTLKGVDIRNSIRPIRLGISALQPWNWAQVGDTTYFAGRAGIFAKDATNIKVDNVKVKGASYGALIVANGDMDVEIWDSSFSHNANGGVVIDGMGASGRFDAILNRNNYIMNGALVPDLLGLEEGQFQHGGAGLYVRAVNYDSAGVTISDTLAMLNRDDGIRVDLLDIGRDEWPNYARATLTDVTALLNGVGVPGWKDLPEKYDHLHADGDGVDVRVETVASSEARINLTRVTAMGNSDDGIDPQVTAYGSGDARIYGTDVNGSFNYDDGLEFRATTHGSGQALIDVHGATALVNGSLDDEKTGIDLSSIANGSGQARIELDNALAVGNNSDGAWLNASANSGSAYIYVRGGVFALNNGEGVHAYASADSTAHSEIGYGVLSMWNDSFGVYSDAYSYYGTARSYVWNDVNAIMNHGPGIYSKAESSSGPWAYSYVQNRIRSIGNDGYGVYSYARGRNGAQAYIDGATALGNNGYGLYAHAHGTTGGAGTPSESRVTGSHAWLNSGYGIRSYAYGPRGYAYSMVADSSAGKNSDYGIYSHAYGTDSVTSPNYRADSQVNNVLSLWNQGYGIQNHAYSMQGAAYSRLNNAVAAGNGDYGIRGYSYGRYYAETTMNGAVALGNTWYGMYAEANASTTASEYTANVDIDNALALWNGGIGINGAAYAVNGYANTHVDNALAGWNSDNGISATADSWYAALVDMNYVGALGNGGRGISATVDSEIRGATLDLDWAVAACNSSEGIYGMINASGSAGTGATAYLDYVGSFNNSGSGIVLDLNGPQASTYAYLNYVASMWNEGPSTGIHLDLDADDSAGAYLNWVQSSRNQGDGIYANIQAGVRGDYDAVAEFNNVNVVGNTGDGIYANLFSENGSAHADFNWVNAMFNQGGVIGIPVDVGTLPNSGIHVEVQGYHAASAEFNYVNSSLNRGDGIYAQVMSGGENDTSWANFNYVNTMGNTGDGIQVDIEDQTSTAYANFNYVNTMFNGGDGIHADINAYNSTASATFNWVNAMFNQGGGTGSTGIDLELYGRFGADADFMFVNASRNVGNGISAVVSAAHGDADLDMFGILGIGNTGAAVRTDVDATASPSADATATIVGFIFGRNGGTALEMDTDSSLGSATNSIDWGLFYSNSGGNWSITANGGTSADNVIGDNIWQF